MSSSLMDEIADRFPLLSQRLAEHQRRMESDPGYRAEVERDEAERKEREEKEEREAIMASRRRAVVARREGAGIPRRVVGLLDAPEKTPAVEAARAFVESGESILVLAGGVGCGKTVAAGVWLDEALARARAREEAEAFHSLGFVSAAGRTVKAIDLSRAGTFDRDFWDDLEVAAFLVIDDLGTEPLDEKGWALANLRALIDSRYDDRKKTLITTNLALDAFLARYGNDGGRLRDRLKETGAFVELTDASLRQAPKHWADTERDS